MAVSLALACSESNFEKAALSHAFTDCEIVWLRITGWLAAFLLCRFAIYYILFLDSILFFSSSKY
jgi:hypothetical protein